MTDSPTGAVTALRTRPLRWVDGTVVPDDLAVVQHVVHEHEIARLGLLDSGPADTAAFLALPDVVRDGSFLVLDGARPVAVAMALAEPQAKDVYADLAALPGPGERLALEAAVAASVAAARAFVARRGEPGWTLRSSCWTTDPVLLELLPAHGLAPARQFHRMRIASDSPAIPAATPPLPPGVELVVRDDEETRRAMWTVDNESFLDHWNFTPWPFDQWWQHFSAGDTRDPDGWWLLRVDGEPAAICILDDSRAEIGDGYVSILGVRRPYRGRGLASWLLQAAFVRHRDLGRAGTQLGVDAENLTGAVGLYERVGMSAVRTLQGHALELS